MKLRTILTLIAATLACTAQAQGAGDDVLLEMNIAYRQGNKRRLVQLLPQARGHALESWAAYWELRARLDIATAQEVQDFYARYPGTSQEDRLRNDWLLLLGQRREWDSFSAEYPRFRMNDDREVRCYALLVQHLREGAAAPAALADEVRRNWLSLRDADDGCTQAASRLIGERQGPARMTAADAEVGAPAALRDRLREHARTVAEMYDPVTA